MRLCLKSMCVFALSLFVVSGFPCPAFSTIESPIEWQDNEADQERQEDQSDSDENQTSDNDAQGSSEQTSEVPRVDFATEIKPLLEIHCLRCHGPDEAENDVRVDELEELIDYDYLVPGDVDGSVLHDTLVSDDPDYQMPPPEESKLTQTQVVLFKRWIEQGAEYPEGEIEFKDRFDELNEDKTAGPDPVANEGLSDDELAADTAEDKDDEKDFPTLLWENVGALHPALVHFPIALLMGGAFFAIFGFRGDSPMGDAAYYCLWLASVTGILASVVGWSYAEFFHPNGSTWDDTDISKTIVQHRWGGILVTVLSVVLTLIAWSSRRADPYANGGLWKIGLVLLAAFCGWVGHLGGDLTHHGEMDKAIERLGLFEKANPAKGDEEKSDDAEITEGESGQPADDEEGTGETSDGANDQEQSGDDSGSSGEGDNGSDEG